MSQQLKEEHKLKGTPVLGLCTSTLGLFTGLTTMVSQVRNLKSRLTFWSNAWNFVIISASQQGYFKNTLWSMG